MRIKAISTALRIQPAEAGFVCVAEAVRCGESALLVGFLYSQATVFALQPEAGNKKAGVPEASPVGAASRREGRFRQL